MHLKMFHFICYKELYKQITSSFVVSIFCYKSNYNAIVCTHSNCFLMLEYLINQNVLKFVFFNDLRINVANKTDSAEINFFSVSRLDTKITFRFVSC